MYQKIILLSVVALCAACSNKPSDSEVKNAAIKELRIPLSCKNITVDKFERTNGMKGKAENEYVAFYALTVTYHYSVLKNIGEELHTWKKEVDAAFKEMSAPIPEIDKKAVVIRDLQQKAVNKLNEENLRRAPDTVINPLKKEIAEYDEQLAPMNAVYIERKKNLTEKVLDLREKMAGHRAKAKLAYFEGCIEGRDLSTVRDVLNDDGTDPVSDVTKTYTGSIELTKTENGWR